MTPARQRSMRRNGASPNSVAPGPFDTRQTRPAPRNGHQQPRNSSFRNRSGGQHIRAADFHQQMVRHDQQRGNQNWHSPQVGGFDPKFMRPVPPFPLPFPFPHPYHPFPLQQAFPFANRLAYPGKPN